MQNSFIYFSGNYLSEGIPWKTFEINTMVNVYSKFMLEISSVGGAADPLCCLHAELTELDWPSTQSKRTQFFIT